MSRIFDSWTRRNVTGFPDRWYDDFGTSVPQIFYPVPSVPTVRPYRTGYLRRVDVDPSISTYREGDDVNGHQHYSVVEGNGYTITIDWTADEPAVRVERRKPTREELLSQVSKLSDDDLQSAIDAAKPQEVSE